MAMESFHNRFPDIAGEETRFVSVLEHSVIPDGQYGFFESYCNDNGCDCRRVMVNVISRENKDKIWATINYGWESKKFYAKFLGSPGNAKEAQGPTLDYLNKQSEEAGYFLELFKELTKEKKYVERLKKHYSLFKKDVNKSSAVKQREVNKKVGRNAPCPCGSGKKYKYCCGIN